MNTVRFDRESAHDEFATDRGAAAWLESFADRISTEAGVQLDGLIGIDGPEVPGKLRELRDALRKLAADATEDPRPAATSPQLTRQEATSTLNSLARIWPELVWPVDGQPGRAFYSAGSSADLALGLLAHQAVELFAGEGRERLRACLAPRCLLFFFKHQTRRDWCSAQCGNRARVARHYQRHHVSGH